MDFQILTVGRLKRVDVRRHAKFGRNLSNHGQNTAIFQDGGRHVCCGQTAAWIKMPLGMEVGLGLRNIVFGVDPAAPEKRAHPPHPIFGPCLLWPNGWMDEDAAWYGSRPRPRPHYTRRGPSSRERGTAAPSFRPMSIMATVAHFSYC